MASLVKDSRSPFYWARFRDETGHEFTRSTREREREKAFEVAQRMEQEARQEKAPHSSIPLEQISQDASSLPALRLVEPESLPLATPSIAKELEIFLHTSILPREISQENRVDISAIFLNFLGPEISALPLRALTRGLLDGYRSYRLNAGIPKESLNFELIFLRDFCQSVVEAGRLSVNEAAEIPLEPDDEIITTRFTLEQLKTLLRTCIHFVHGDDWRGVIAISITTGRPLTQIVNLRSRDLIIDGEKPLLRFPEMDDSFEPTQDYFLHPYLVEYLFLRNLSKNSEAFIFPSLADRRLDGSHGLIKEFSNLISAAGIDCLSPELLENGHRIIHEHSYLSLEYPLSEEELKTVMQSSFLVRLKRAPAREIEWRDMLPAPAITPQQIHDPYPPSRGTRTI